MKSLTLILCASALIGAAPGKSATPGKPAPRPATIAEYRRDLELERRLQAVVAKSPDVWGISVRHMERHEVAGLHENDRFLMASVFKIPILVELYSQISAGKISLEDRVTIEKPEAYFGSGVLAMMRPGMQPTIHDLATLMITVSDNMATDLLLARVGKENVTARMRALGLSKTSVDRSTREHTLESFGLRDPQYEDFTPADVAKFDFQAHENEIVKNQQIALRDCHNCSTPSEMSRLLELIAAGKAGDAAATKDIMGLLSKQQFNQRLPRYLPVGIRFAHKTGTVTNPVVVVNDAGVIFLPKGDHVVVTAFSKGTGINLDEEALKKTMNDAEDIAAEIGRTVFDYYTTAR